MYLVASIRLSVRLFAEKGTIVYRLKSVEAIK